MADVDEISMDPWMMGTYKAANLNVMDAGGRMQGTMEESVQCAGTDGVVSQQLQDMVRGANDFMKSCELTAIEGTNNYVGADNESALVIDGVVSQ
ncbi:hypothetical protein OG205_45430 [Lentzea sp. NBC_00516]|jgi:hypothetical protein|uniref:hypothetical protein n=1 Tax=Lentzea sp. NBC_00516 TaxID=2903582 RepID=UPI002E81A224|nr:hypothetical protein [Lentzea sp. NBC_00516]WUD25182.1 hypothetical protein OG205_45430 [Lentzea sp. NBC_00516]